MPTTVGGIVVYTTGEAAKIIGCSKDTLYKYIRTKQQEDVARDDKKNRSWTDSDIERFRAQLNANVEKKMRRK